MKEVEVVGVQRLQDQLKLFRVYAGDGAGYQVGRAVQTRKLGRQLLVPVAVRDTGARR